MYVFTNVRYNFKTTLMTRRCPDISALSRYLSAVQISQSCPYTSLLSRYLSAVQKFQRHLSAVMVLYLSAVQVNQHFPDIWALSRYLSAVLVFQRCPGALSAVHSLYLSAVQVSQCFINDSDEMTAIVKDSVLARMQIFQKTFPLFWLN